MRQASKIYSCLLGTLLVLPAVPRAQEAKLIDKLILETQLSLMIENKDYVFLASTIRPLTGMPQQATSVHSLRVAGDTVIADLPFYGNSFSSSYTGAAGIQFTSVKNNYAIKARPKGGWDIAIRPGNRSGVQQMQLTILPNGEATLHVVNVSRDPMSFNGYIQRKEKPAAANPATPTN